MTQPQKPRIAITGGGIASAILIHSLLKHQQLDVQIIDAAPEFEEAGARIEITQNTLAAF